MAVTNSGLDDPTVDPSRSPVQVTVVLPCLDEVESVGLCVREALEAFTASGLTGEVVVVDNGSTDGSAAAAAAAGARVVHETRPGYGSALRAGFAAAEGEVIVMADADCTYPLDRLAELVQPVLDHRSDLVLGRRLDEASRQTMPFLHRYLGTPAITFLTARACGRRLVTDSQSGFRAFRRADLPRMELRGTGMELATEMLIRSARNGLHISEVHTGYRPRIGESKLNTWSDGWRHLMLLLMLAPDLLLIGPGVALTAVGVFMTLLAFTNPEGIAVGSLNWQPVFFSGIALVVGVQCLLAGALIAARGTVPVDHNRRLVRAVQHPRFRKRSFAAGLTMVVAGLVLNAVLFFGWLQGDPNRSANFGVQSLAQSLIIVGVTFTIAAVVSHFLLLDREPETADRPLATRS